MDELFKQIITGETDIKLLEKTNTGTSKKVQNTNDIARYFLRVSKRKYNDDQLKKKHLKNLLAVYNDLLKENKTIKRFINSKEKDKDLQKDAEKIIKLFVDDYVKSINDTSVWTKELKVAGFVEPLLIGIITLLISLIIAGNIYLMM